MKPRLLFVGAFPPPGSSIVGGNVADCAALMASSFTDEVEVIPLDSTAVATTPQPLHRRAAHSAARMRRFLRAMREGRPDVVLLFCSGGLSFIEKSAFAAYARARGVPALLSVRSGHFMDQVRASRVFRVLARHLLGHPRLLICQGRTWQEFFQRWFGVSRERCPIVESWVATQDVLAIGQARDYTPRRGPLRILFLGAVEPFKGVFDLLDAVERLARVPGAPQFVVSIAGDGSARSAAREWVQTHGMQAHVEFTGVLHGEAKLRALATADVFVLPSHTEGLPNAMIEAMASGLPVVVTPVGSIPDVIDHGQNGLLAPARDAAALATTLQGLLASAEGREQLGRAAHETAKRRFAVERGAAQLASLVRALRDTR